MYFLILSFIACIIYKSSRKKISSTQSVIDILFETAATDINKIKKEFRKISNIIRNIRLGSKSFQPMSPDEALAILGLDKNCSKEDINQAFKKLMMQNHPDKGGSKYIASKIIEARDVLL